MKFTVNGTPLQLTRDVDPDMPLLWYIRDYASLPGSKSGCDIRHCSAYGRFRKAIYRAAEITALASEAR